jgi:hypothetical protein
VTRIRNCPQEQDAVREDIGHLAWGIRELTLDWFGLWRLHPRLHSLLLLLLLQLFFLRHVMTDDATGRGTQHRVVSGHVPRHRAYGCTFDATLGCGSLRTSEESDSKR